MHSFFKKFNSIRRHTVTTTIPCPVRPHLPVYSPRSQPRFSPTCQASRVTLQLLFENRGWPPGLCSAAR